MAQARKEAVERHAGGVKTELIREILKRLNAAPERVLFPRGNSR